LAKSRQVSALEQTGVCEISVARLTECTPAVVERLNVLTPQLKPSWDPITSADVISVLESPTRVYVARVEDVIVGVVLLVPHRHLPGLRYHVEDVVVDAQFRRRGIARLLLTTAMGDVPSEVKSFDLRSHRARRPAHDLYVSLGFETSDTTVFRKAARPHSGSTGHGAWT
jgi:ribosomal protein S18 acetylase RimI-like enzyme